MKIVVNQDYGADCFSSEACRLFNEARRLVHLSEVPSNELAWTHEASEYKLFRSNATFVRLVEQSSAAHYLGIEELDDEYAAAGLWELRELPGGGDTVVLNRQAIDLYEDLKAARSVFAEEFNATRKELAELTEALNATRKELADVKAKWCDAADDAEQLDVKKRKT